MPNKKPKILFISYECSPFIKLGGLGDVALGLPKAVKRLGADIRVIVPFYKQIDAKKFKIKPAHIKLTVEYDGKNYQVEIHESTLPGSSVPIYFLKNKYFFERKEIFDNLSRDKFLFFQEAILELIKDKKWQPDILHCNDWQTGMIPLMIKDKAKENPFYRRFKTLYTIHNLAYQGDADPDVLDKIELKLHDYASLTKDFLMDKDIDYTYQGIAHANLINTVSPTYAKEIMTREYGVGLQALLRSRKKDVFGIINGLDLDDWNPKTDKNIKFKLKNASVQLYKHSNKVALQKQVGLPVSEKIPVISLISRLAYQKGLNLVFDWLESELNSKTSEFNSRFQFILLGTGSKELEKQFSILAKKYPEQVAAVIGFNIKLASQIYAGSDMFLMPSRYEPCGLGQMISMRYGTVPIVRETGGLKDTVSNYPKKHEGRGIGFAFASFSSNELINATNKAIKTYKISKQWQKMVEYNIGIDFSWQKPAKEYLSLYNKLVSSKK